MRLSNKSILLLILLVAAALRLHNFFEIPYTHDEFSALFRLDFKSFAELINKGIKIDGHPAGVQVFLYYYTDLFGTREWVVKLPFILSGISAVYLVYAIGKKWFNETVGLISAAYMASIQFTVVYSQIARPYASGLFLSVLMVYFWSNLTQAPQRNFYRNWTLFVLSAALCAYNHHFSLLFAAIVGLSGVFVIPRKYVWKYVLAGLAVLVLYIPHLNIFFYQLDIGGVEAWLARPQNDFIVQHIYYAFNYAIPSLLIGFGIAAFGWGNIPINKRAIRWAFLGLTWFLLPLLIGFFYSRYQSAVIQHSVLIFSFPFLLFALFGLVKEQSPKINLAVIVLILFANSYALIEGRKHYELFYNSIYEQILVDAETVEEENVRTTFLIHSDPLIMDYYSGKLGATRNYLFYVDSFQSISDLKRFLKKESEWSDQLYLGSLSSIAPNVVPLIRDYFPRIEKQNNYFGGTTYVFSKREDVEDRRVDLLDFESTVSDHWNPLNPDQIVPRPGDMAGKAYRMPAELEWGPSFSMPLSDVIRNENNFIDTSVKFSSIESPEKVLLVASLEANGETVYWGGTDFSEFILPGKDQNQWEKVHHSVKLSDIELDYSGLQLNVFIWNKGKRQFLIDDFQINLRNGNPVVYGLVEKF